MRRNEQIIKGLIVFAFLILVFFPAKYEYIFGDVASMFQDHTQRDTTRICTSITIEDSIFITLTEIDTTYEYFTIFIDTVIYDTTKYYTTIYDTVRHYTAIYDTVYVDTLIVTDTLSVTIYREILKDTLIYNIINKDSSVYNIMYKDSIVYNIINEDSTIYNINYIDTTIYNITYIDSIIQPPDSVAIDTLSGTIDIAVRTGVYFPWYYQITNNTNDIIRAVTTTVTSAGKFDAIQTVETDLPYTIGPDLGTTGDDVTSDSIYINFTNGLPPGGQYLIGGNNAGHFANWTIKIVGDRFIRNIFMLAGTTSSIEISEHMESYMKTVIVSWNPNKEVDLDHYTIYWYIDAINEYSLNVRNVVSAEIIVSRLSPGPVYFEVTATDFAGNESIRSNTVIFILGE